MSDLKSPTLIYLKGFLFLGLGVCSAGLLIALTTSWEVAALLGVCVWAFCRFYYFAFYVIQHYINPEYRYAGLWAFVTDLVRNGIQKPQRDP